MSTHEITHYEEILLNGGSFSAIGGPTAHYVSGPGCCCCLLRPPRFTEGHAIADDLDEGGRKMFAVKSAAKVDKWSESWQELRLQCQMIGVMADDSRPMEAYRFTTPIRFLHLVIVWLQRSDYR